MLQEITGLPDGVVGFEASGRLDAADYRDALVPALEEAARSGAIRLVVVMSSFDGMSPEAVWEDTKVGISNWTAWKRVAVVTDIEWMGHALRWFGWMSPGEVRHFALADREAAITWAAG